MLSDFEKDWGNNNTVIMRICNSINKSDYSMLYRVFQSKVILMLMETIVGIRELQYKVIHDFLKTFGEILELLWVCTLLFVWDQPFLGLEQCWKTLTV